MKLSFQPNLSCFDRKRGLNLPEVMSEDLAEFLGILTGDGCINKYVRGRRVDYWISITGHSIDDKKYFEDRLTPLYKRLLNLNVKIDKLKGQKTIRITTRSKGLFNFLKDIGMNIGPKDNIVIPRVVMENKKFLLFFFKGLVDTDGTLYLRNGIYPVLSIKQKSKGIIVQVEKLLRQFGFSPCVDYNIIRIDKRGFISIGHRLYLNGRKNLVHWLKLIGFGNPKHKTKCTIN